jgi:hypothetical protein
VLGLDFVQRFHAVAGAFGRVALPVAVLMGEHLAKELHGRLELRFNFILLGTTDAYDLRFSCGYFVGTVD